MAERMAGHFDHLGLMRSDADDIALLDRLIERADLRRLLGRSDDADIRIGGLQPGNALDMIGMMMGHENIGEPPVLFGERFEDRRRIRRIDRRGRAAFGRMDQHAEIVGKTQKLMDFQHDLASLVMAIEARRSALRQALACLNSKFGLSKPLARVKRASCGSGRCENGFRARAEHARKTLCRSISSICAASMTRLWEKSRAGSSAARSAPASSSSIGQSIMGVGYATPYLDLFRGEALRVLAFMPAAQGVVNWPLSGLSASALVEPVMMPLPDSCIDRVLVVHALEIVDHPRELLDEIWRILTPGGRMIAVVPRRAGLWARLDTTPFGYGQPYSRSQLRELMRDALFSPTYWTEALYAPPFERRMFLRSAALFESIGAKLSLPGAGVTIVEATKQLYRPIGVRRVARQALPQLQPVIGARPAGMAPN